MKKIHLHVFIQFITMSMIISCNKNISEFEKIENFELNNEIEISKGFVEKNKPYKIKPFSYYVSVFLNDEWHNIINPFGGGVIIFGENTTIFSGKYFEPSFYNLSAEYYLTIIDENNNLLIKGIINQRNVSVKIIDEIVEIQFINVDNNLVKHIFEIEDYYK